MGQYFSYIYYDILVKIFSEFYLWFLCEFCVGKWVKVGIVYVFKPLLVAAFRLYS